MKWAVFPKEIAEDVAFESVDNSKSEKMERSTSKNEISDRTFKRYNPSLFSAFRDRIEDGKRRIICLENGVSFIDVLPDYKPFENEIEIKRSFLNQSEEERGFREIDSAIRTWAGEQGINLTPYFEMQGPQKPERHENRTIGRAIDALPDQDLSRISIPMDIVRKMVSA